MSTQEPPKLSGLQFRTQLPKGAAVTGGGSGRRARRRPIRKIPCAREHLLPAHPQRHLHHRGLRAQARTRDVSAQP